MSRTGPTGQSRGRRTPESVGSPAGDQIPDTQEDAEARMTPETRKSPDTSDAPDTQEASESRSGPQEPARQDVPLRSVEVRGCYTVEEARALVVATNGRRLAVGAGFGVALALTPSMGGSVLAGLLTGAVALVLIGGLLAWMVLINLPRRVVRAMPEDITWTVDADGFRIRTPEADTSVGWDDIERVSVSRRLVRFQRASRSSFLPRRLLDPAELAAVEALAGAAGVEVRSGGAPGDGAQAGRAPGDGAQAGRAPGDEAQAGGVPGDGAQAGGPDVPRAGE
ncbi:MAG: YcxB family protein [Actinomycetales bacterium]|nr:YcxB family protein [Actinomycetales bacterium]